MSKTASSPTARLLQSSRLFSLPRPLPIQPELTSGLYRHSDTATTAHPTYQAIATPASSLSRGDWGLKRNLPGKRTKSSTPAIRVRANDTYEHITDFTSAGDHVLTERKWAEMAVPLLHSSARQSKYSRNERGPMSAFEEQLDNTDPDAKQRWKYKGPWLAGMQDGEFERWLDDTLKKSGSSKDAWRTFLRDKLWTEKKADAVRQQRNNRLSVEDGDVAPAEVEQPTPSELQQYQKRLREDHNSHGLSSTLTAHICEFLDLPNVYTQPQSSVGFNPMQALQIANLTNADSETGPPTTHPSAGLGHLRTSAVMTNHPIQGPLKERIAVESRVVRPRTQLGKVLEYVAKVGVGGVVADDAVSATSKSPSSSRGGESEADKAAHSLDDLSEDGGKIWVTPREAYIDHRSRVRLTVSRAGQEVIALAEAAKRGGNRRRVDEIFQMKTAGRVGTAARSPSATLPAGMGFNPPRAGAAGSARTAAKPYQGVEGFDAEMRREQ